MLHSSSRGRTRRVLPRGIGFIFGGLSAAIFVLGLLGASLALSHAIGGSLSERGHYRISPAQLSLATLPAEVARQTLS